MLPEDKLLQLKMGLDSLPDRKPWVPNPGAQTAALETMADELFFGGEPGSSKSSLLVGAAITEHHRSIIFRREYPQIKGLEDEAARILGSREGYNASSHVWRIPGSDRVLEFGSVPHEYDAQRYQGRAHDAKLFDELPQFSRSQYRYLTLWTRSAKPGQRTRIIGTGNPPTSPEQLWVIEHWGAWLDPTNPDPALPGELRWPVPVNDDSDQELFFRSLDEALVHIETLKKPPRDHKGQIIPPRSRTFIPGKLQENPDLHRSGYGAVLAYTSKELRNLASGNFDAALTDDPNQVIPTWWIIEAEKRWTPQPPKGVPMIAIGVDVALGGPAETVIAPRHDWWYAQLIVVPGIQTPKPSDVAGLVVTHRRDNAAVIVDCGGGFGSGVVERLEDNTIATVAFKGANEGIGRTRDKQHRFFNKRAEAIWRFREALDPDQDGGSPVALPPDPKLRADLASYRYRIGPRGIQVEDKADTSKRIGRSPDRGDGVIMAGSEGDRALRKGLSGPGARNRDNTRPSFAKVRPGPLTRNNRYGNNDDDGGAPPWRR